MPKSGALNPKQAAFAREYIKDHNGAQAAIRAGYAKKAARTQASDLLTKPNVQAEIKRLEAPALLEARVDSTRVALELGRIATSDPAGLVDSKGFFITDLRKIPEDLRRAISSFDLDTFTDISTGTRYQFVSKVRFWDKNKALETLAKILKMLQDQDDDAGDLDRILTYLKDHKA
ncbi:phage terminase small subunit [Gammaproteobacteria bacterium]